MAKKAKTLKINDKDYPLFFKAVEIEKKKGEDYNAGGQ
jgi:hypothetical protein